MPLILMKNNLKLMLRSKWVLFMMSILPLITIALLSNAFKNMLNTSYEIDQFPVGYRLETDSRYKDLLPSLKKVCEENKVILQEYPEGNIPTLLQNESVAVFVEIKDSSYIIYQASGKKTEASITESIFYSFFYKMNESMTMLSYGGVTNVVDYEDMELLKTEVLDVEPVPSSTDYYGIIYIIYFAWCGMISLVAVISSERKSAIPRRLRVSNMSRFDFYLAKLVPCTLAVFIEICIAWMLSVLLFDIHWGDILISTLVLFLISLGASAFGILLFQLFSNVAISIVLGFVIIWVAGFFGGSFQTYMYAHLPQKLVDLSPLYYINRAMVELSTKGSSDYLGKCIGSIVLIIIVCSILGVLSMNLRKEEQ